MELAILAVFVVGYLFITMEHAISINKTASALLTGVLCWTIYALNYEGHDIVHQLMEHLGEISSILFFLMGAMTIVELIDAHDGFEIINSRISTKSRRKLLWLVAILTFFLSAILDNLTTTIVMVTLVIKMVKNERVRLLFIGMIIIAANSGGAWSPIGDITTTMLWIGGQISTESIVGHLFFPSLVSMLVPLILLTFIIEGELQKADMISPADPMLKTTDFDQKFIFISGLIVLVSVPVFKTVTHLPPFMGMLLGLGVLWFITEVIHRKKEVETKKKLSVVRALEHMDVPSVLFFLGILLAVSVLQNTGQLASAATFLTDTIKNERLILTTIGLLSAIVDNVPLVAATMGMYSLDVYTMNDPFWILLAFVAGTGGSVLIIGSAAGVAAMGLERIPFGWYLKNIAWLALAGYFSGIVTFMIQSALVG